MAFCGECDQPAALDQRVGEKCLLCGTTLTAVLLSPRNAPSAGENRQVSHDERAFPGHLNDIFGVDVLEMLSRQRAPDREISQSYMQSVGALLVDERRTALLDVSISLGPLTLLGILGSFSTTPLSPQEPLCTKETEESRTAVIEAPIFLADPIHGEHPLYSPAQYKDCVVMFQRGKVSFAAKVLAAEAAGARAVIVAQAQGKWPFQMTDSTRELQHGESRIPCLMIGERDAEMCEKYIRSRSSSVVRVAFKGEAADCAICQESFAVGESVYRLECHHTYHSQCLAQWLPHHHSCPLCRQQLKSQSTHETRCTSVAEEKEVEGDGHGGFRFFS